MFKIKTDKDETIFETRDAFLTWIKTNPSLVSKTIFSDKDGKVIEGKKRNKFIMQAWGGEFGQSTTST